MLFHPQSPEAPRPAGRNPPAGGVLAPGWQVSAAQFARETFVAAVTPGAGRHLEPSTALDREELERLVAQAAQHAPLGKDGRRWAREGLQALMAEDFEGDVCVCELPGIVRVVLVKLHQVEYLTLVEVVRRAHLRQVQDALEAGEPVPDAVQLEWRQAVEQMLPDAAMSETPY